MNKLSLLLVCCATALLAPPSPASLPPERTREYASRIDTILAAHHKETGTQFNAAIPDEVFLRRIYLDLAGRIPTAAETAEFLDSRRTDKRADLIEDLLQRESYVSNFYNFWADILRLKSYYNNTANVVPATYEAFLKESLRGNKPYDRFVFEMLSARGYAWNQGAVGYYLRDSGMPLDNMALTSRVFLGTRIECAQCHDHPFDKWKQTEFYHLAAYTIGNESINEAFGNARDEIRALQDPIEADFKREKAVSTDGGKAASQRRQERLDALEYRKMVGIIKSGVDQLFSPIGLERKKDAPLKLPFDFRHQNGRPGDVMEPRPLFGTVENNHPGEDRAQTFAHWVTSPRNATFTKVAVNRLWKRMLGVALLEPLDDLNDSSTPMVPALENYLESLMMELRYDMRAFLSVIANTRVYQSAVHPEQYSTGSVYHFPGPVLRRMSAEQIWDSLVALANHEPDMRNLIRDKTNARRVGVSHMTAEAYETMGGKWIVETARRRIEEEKKHDTLIRAVQEEMVVAKRAGDSKRLHELQQKEGELRRQRGEGMVRDFIQPLLENLAKAKGGPEARPIVDELYAFNSNPSVMTSQTWKRMFIPGYGPTPETAAEQRARVEAEKGELRNFATRLGFTEKDHAGFLAYSSKARTEWIRASELESPAPRGHFLRTMGQSDRDFVENANPNPSIPQALILLNGELLSERGLFSPYSPLMNSIRRVQNPEQQAEVIWLSLLSRRPSREELNHWQKAQGDGLATPEDLAYSLLNTKQFLFIR